MSIKKGTDQKKEGRTEYVLPPNVTNQRVVEFIRHAVAYLTERGTLKPIDYVSIDALALQLQTYYDARKRVSEEGMIIEINNGKTAVPHPCLRVANEALSSAIRLMDHYGLNELSRKNLNRKGDQAIDLGNPVAKWLKEK